jgi:hypothetical protein
VSSLFSERVASGSFVQRKYEVPLYLGPPDRPYRVLGSIEVEAPIGVFRDRVSSPFFEIARVLVRFDYVA